MRTSITRLIAALIAALLPVVLLPSPADAAAVVIVSRSGTTAGTPAVEMGSFDCVFPFSSAPTGADTVDRAAGPGAAPLGLGSLRIGQLQPGLVSGVAFHNRSLSRLASAGGQLRGWFRSDLPARVRSVLRVTLDNTAHATWIGEAVVRNLAAGTWQQADGLEPQYLWVKQFPGDGVERRTLAGFRRAHGPGTVEGYLGGYVRSSEPNALACNAFTGTTVYVDNFRISKSGGDTQVFNFEPRLVTSASISASAKVITSGGSTTLKTTLRHLTRELSGRTMFLLARPYGASGYTQVGSGVTTDSNGVARKTVTPARNTTYVWYFKGDKNYRPVQSPVQTVGVRTKVTLTLADSMLLSGESLVANGTVTPAKVGVEATLWRATANGPVELGSVSLTDGTYQITAVLSGKGTYNVYVTVPSAAGNLKGTSPTRTATVS